MKLIGRDVVLDVAQDRILCGRGELGERCTFRGEGVLVDRGEPKVVGVAERNEGTAEGTVDEVGSAGLGGARAVSPVSGSRSRTQTSRRTRT